MIKKRPIRVEGDIAYVPLTRGFEATIDASDAPIVAGNNWFAIVCKRTVYAGRSVLVEGKMITVMMHRVILRAPQDMHVDHIDGDGLNNRRLNMRLATRAENNRNARRRIDNMSGFKGVHWHARDNAWQAQINFDGLVKYLGAFRTAEAAHAAYGEASKRLHGKFGRVA
jgi:hypothetical protein